jgi:hypothetical protein
MCLSEIKSTGKRNDFDVLVRCQVSFFLLCIKSDTGKCLVNLNHPQRKFLSRGLKSTGSISTAVYSRFLGNFVYLLADFYS